ncbi:hypothetical protein MRBLWH7_000117 [Microbacterium sp. LWH7-1.2]|uniref:hypothetical protein n=1 Tax=Microbacterium sp. LWH7-1.2 TaxID=3135257 RepID=UPI0031395FC4
MTLSDALAALRALDLPVPRIKYLAARVVADPAEAHIIVRSARAEAERVRAERDAAAGIDMAQRAAYAVRQSQTAAEKPSEASRTWQPREDEEPEPRPVRITYTAPRKPEIVREPNRPEQSEGFERTRAQRKKPKSEKRTPRGSATKHGTTSAYSDGCRCQPCRDAVAVYKREYRMRKAQATNS